jgi:hypothetical protein
MFDLQETRATFNYVVTGSNLGKQFTFVGEFNVMTTDDFIVFKNAIRDDVGEQGPDEVWSPYVEKCFVGWVNIPGQTETWIASNGQPAECTGANRACFLSRPGVSQAIVFAFMEAFRGGDAIAPLAAGEDEGLGNSQLSPVAGTTETPEPERGS